MNLQRFQQKLILLGLIIVPFISLGELIALFAGRLSSQSNNLTGVFKFSKDIIFILLILLGIVNYLIKDRLNRKMLIYLGIVILLVVPSVIFSFGNDILYLAAGLRWLIPILLPIFIYSILDKKFLGRFFQIIYYLLILHLVIQSTSIVFCGILVWSFSLWTESEKSRSFFNSKYRRFLYHILPLCVLVFIRLY